MRRIKPFRKAKRLWQALVQQIFKKAPESPPPDSD